MYVVQWGWLLFQATNPWEKNILCDKDLSLGLGIPRNWMILKTLLAIVTMACIILMKIGYYMGMGQNPGT